MRGQRMLVARYKDRMNTDRTRSGTAATAWHYGTPAIALHWIIALLIFGMIALGWTMMSIEKEPGAEVLFDLHKSFGLTVFGLIVLRILWRSGHRPEGLPDSVPAWQARLSMLSHWALYACMIVMPITGYLGASHQKKPPKWFGFNLPNWAAPDHDIAEAFFTVHSITTWVLVVLIALHTLAALKHLLMDRDGVFQRMWMGRRHQRT